MEPNTNHEAVERILQHIEYKGLDLTTPYSNWIKLAFAMASLGESGRSYFHRLSRFYPEYDPAECDLKFSQCLASKGTGVNLATFFHLAKEAGIPLAPSTKAVQGVTEEEEKMEAEVEKLREKLPALPDEVFDTLPGFLKRVLEPAESRAERDVLLLGSMTVISSCLPCIYGVYDGFEVYSNLYLYVTAPASSGKGKLNLCKRLVLPIHLKKRKEAESMQLLFDEALADGDKGGDKPERPKAKMLFLPANSSATGVFQLLSDNEGRGLIFETEGDTLSNTLKSDFGNYSDGYRKCFHHETISFYRRTDREYVDIQTPCLSTLLSGTPNQVHGLIPHAENGLFSRFLFYHLELDPAWKDTFRNRNTGELLDYYHHLGLDFAKFYEVICSQPPIQVQLSEAQQDRFFQFFSTVQGRYLALIDDGFVATVRRMGLICFRLMMVFSALRFQGHSELPHKLLCREEDFEAALAIIQVLLRHSNHVFDRLPKIKEVQEKENLRLSLLQRLPLQFTYAEYLKTAQYMQIPKTSAFRILKLFRKEGLIKKMAFNTYGLTSTENLWGDQFLHPEKGKP